jgi:hypothetical protein
MYCQSVWKGNNPGHSKQTYFMNFMEDTMKKLYVEIGGKRYYIAREIVIKYELKKGDSTPYTKLLIREEV